MLEDVGQIFSYVTLFHKFIFPLSLELGQLFIKLLTVVGTSCFPPI